MLACSCNKQLVTTTAERAAFDFQFLLNDLVPQQGAPQTTNKNNVQVSKKTCMYLDKPISLSCHCNLTYATCICGGVHQTKQVFVKDLCLFDCDHRKPYCLLSVSLEEHHLCISVLSYSLFSNVAFLY